MTSKTLRYLVPPQGPEVEPIKGALALLQRLCDDFRRDAILLLPTKRNIQSHTMETALGPHAAKALRKGKPVSLAGGWNVTLKTQRTFRDHWTSHVIIAVYPTKKMLDQIDTATSAPAVIVVPWIMEQVAEWRKTWNPHVLGQTPTPPERLIESRLVEEALKMLTRTVNLRTGLSHPSDREAAVQILRLLYQNGEVYDPHSIRAWALRNGWDPEGADQLREVAQAILDRRRIRQGPQYWRADIMAVLRKRAKND
jgi:hypothetical protein